MNAFLGRVISVMAICAAAGGGCSGSKGSSGSGAGEPTTGPASTGSAQQASAGSATEQATAELTLPLQPCPAFKRIPSPITKNTVVDDTCLTIPAGGAVKVNPGVSLIIIARRQLSFGAGTSIDLRGEAGGQGPNASTQEETWRAEEPNRGEKIACACQDRSCRDGWTHCSPSGNAALRGGKGQPGTAAGNIHIVAYELVGAANVKLLASGGDGGPPGQSGHTHCWEGKNGGLECNSGPAPNNGQGEPGANGAAHYEAGTKTADAQMADLVKATDLRAPATPPTTHVVDTRASFTRAVKDARDEGQAYDNVSGQ